MDKGIIKERLLKACGAALVIAAGTGEIKNKIIKGINSFCLFLSK